MLNKYYLNVFGVLPPHFRITERRSFSIFSAISDNLFLREIIVSSLLLMELLPTIYYFGANIMSLTKATAAFYVIAIFAKFVLSYWSLLANRTCLIELLDKLHDSVLLSIYTDRLNREKKIEFDIVVF